MADGVSSKCPPGYNPSWPVVLGPNGLPERPINETLNLLGAANPRNSQNKPNALPSSVFVPEGPGAVRCVSQRTSSPNPEARLWKLLSGACAAAAELIAAGIPAGCADSYSLNVPNSSDSLPEPPLGFGDGRDVSGVDAESTDADEVSDDSSLPDATGDVGAEDAGDPDAGGVDVVSEPDVTEPKDLSCQAQEVGDQYPASNYYYKFSNPDESGEITFTLHQEVNTDSGTKECPMVGQVTYSSNEDGTYELISETFKDNVNVYLAQGILELQLPDRVTVQIYLDTMEPL